jgi:hypothetical protein
MKNGVVELEESETPTYLYPTLLCDGCHLEHRVRIPYAKGIGKIKFTCDGKELLSDFPFAWSLTKTLKILSLLK